MKGKKTTDKFQFTVLFEPAEEGGYIVTVPALPGLMTQGDSLLEARRMAKDAIKGYLESLRKDNLPIPQDKPLKLKPVKEKVEITLKTA